MSTMSDVASPLFVSESLHVKGCSACGGAHQVQTSVDLLGNDYFICLQAPGGPTRVDVFRVGEAAGAQPPPKPGNAPATWDLVVTDMRRRDETGEKRYGVRHQFDNGRDHLVDAYEESLDQSCYLRAEVEKRKRMRELARVVRSPENSSPLTELLDLIEAGS